MLEAMRVQFQAQVDRLDQVIAGLRDQTQIFGDNQARENEKLERAIGEV